MKNLKNTIAAIGMMAVLGMGTVTANAGILITDRTGAVTEESLETSIIGIIVVGIKGIIVVGQNGFLTSDGILITDRTSDGILITD